MSRLRRILAPIAAVLTVSAGITLAAAQTEPAATAPLGTWCPQVTAPTAGQQVTCKVVPDPDWVPPTTTAAPTTTTSSVAPSTTTDPAPTTTTAPRPLAYPNDTNTGVPSVAALTTHSGDLIVTNPNAVVDGKNITGSLLVRASGVTIRNSRIQGRINNDFGGVNNSFTMTDSTVGPDSGCTTVEAIGYGNYTLTRVRVKNFVDGPRVSGSNVLIQDSFITTCKSAGAHGDGIQGYYGGTNVVIKHNTVDVRASHPDVTSAIFIADNSKSAHVVDNLLAGGGYTLRLHNDTNNAGSNWRASGNRIVNRSWISGDTYNTNVCGKSGAVWSDNTLVTAGADYQPSSTVGTSSC